MKQELTDLLAETYGFKKPSKPSKPKTEPKTTSPIIIPKISHDVEINRMDLTQQQKGKKIITKVRDIDITNGTVNLRNYDINIINYIYNYHMPLYTNWIHVDTINNEHNLHIFNKLIDRSHINLFEIYYNFYTFNNYRYNDNINNLMLKIQNKLSGIYF